MNHATQLHRDQVEQAIAENIATKGVGEFDGVAGKIPCPVCEIGTIRYYRWSHGQGLRAMCNRVCCIAIRQEVSLA